MGSRWLLSAPVTCPLAGINQALLFPCIPTVLRFSNISVYQDYLESLLMTHTACTTPKCLIR